MDMNTNKLDSSASEGGGWFNILFSKLLCSPFYQIKLLD